MFMFFKNNYNVCFFNKLYNVIIMFVVRALQFYTKNMGKKLQESHKRLSLGHTSTFDISITSLVYIPFYVRYILKTGSLSL